MLFEIVTLLFGLMVLIYSSDKTVENSVKIAKAFKVPPLIIGIVLISFGTDVPEIANSVISSYLGHGDINVGDTFGSPLAQIALVLGLVAFLGRSMRIKQSEIAHLGVATLAATLLALVLVSDGDITRGDAATLIVSYIVFLVFICGCDPRKLGITKIKESAMKGREQLRVFMVLGISILGVIAGAGLVVNSVIGLSEGMGIPEFLLSFFVVGLGTSLPELAVEISAVRRGELGLAIGDAFGSNITDLTLALGLGPLFFPNELTAGLVNPGGLYLIAATAVVVALLGWRRKLGKAEGMILILIYLASYLVIPNL